MTLIREVVHALERWAPPEWADSYDNVGLLWGDPNGAVKGVLTALDLTPAVLQEAQELSVNLIIVHHPPWFGQRTRLLWESFADRVIYEAIRADIAVYAAHTNADHAPEGVSHALCRELGLRPVRFLREVAPTHGAGYIGEWSQPIDLPEFLRRLREIFGMPSLRLAPGAEGPIQRVAVCGGAGSFLLPEALAAGVQAFLTADIPYHRFFEAQGRLWLIDIGHYESERAIIGVFAELVRREFPDLPTFASRIRTNPVQYWI